MKKLAITYLILFALAITLGFINQDDPLKKLLSQLEKYRTEYNPEKIHLHLDKPYYAIGDNIWFKAYVVGAKDHQLSALSQIMYVELINDKDSVKQSLRLALNNGLANGDFTLPDTLREGNYRIRAYTTWMRNFGEEYFFDKTISIGNSISNTILTDTKYTFSKVGNNQKVEADITYTNLQGEPYSNKEVNYNVQLDFRDIAKGKGITDGKGKLKISFINSQPYILKSGKIFTSIKLDEKRTVAKTIPVKSTSNDVDLQFFPESGNLVYGIRSKVAFKALGADGLGVPVTGSVTNQANDQIAQLQTEHAGMGYFALQPKEGEDYKAIVKFYDGSEKTVDLPKPLKDGYVISANNLDYANLVVSVAMSPSLQTTGDLTLVAQLNGVVFYASKAQMDKSFFSAVIPKTRFPTGIIQLTLFSAANQPVAERLVFINHSDPLNIKVSSAKSETGKREKIKLTINATSPDGKPANGSFSLSVIDESKVPFDEINETTIVSNLLFSSELKGYVEQPNYYFVNVDIKKVLQLDILMLTQGWRRFIWKNLLSNTFPILSYAPERNLKISGRVTANNGTAVVGGKVTLFSAAGDVYLMDTITNSEGRFIFNDLYFNDSTKFVIQARNQKDRKNVRIELDNVPPQIVTKNKNLPDLETNVNNSLIAYLINSRNQYNELKRYGLAISSIILAEVKIVETRPLVKHSANLNGAGNADNIITAKDLQYATDLATFLQGRVAGIIIRNGIAYSSRSMNSSFRGPVPMQLIIDGMYVQPDFLSTINPHDVESIEVLKSASNTAIYGMRGGGGVLIVNTKRGERNMGYGSYSPGIISFKPQGLYQSREFYSPNYDDPKINPKMADLRTTIFWHPNLITDQSGKATVEYFNSDGTGNYAVIVEGININGDIGRTVYRYKVD